MKRTALKKLSIILLFTCIFVNCVSACGNTGTESVNSPENETTVSETETEAAETEAPVNITDERFEGKEFNIIYMTGGSYGMGNEVDYTFEESQSTVVSEAVYQRNLLTEEKLGITINGTYLDPAQFNNKIVNLVQSGDSTYDAILNYLRYNYQIVIKGVLINISEIDEFCLDNPWWDQGINDNFRFFNEKQFFATGDICIDDDCTGEVMFFNKKMYDDYGLSDPYETVRNGKWTLDTMTANMAGVKADLNGDGKFDKNDRWGYCGGIGVIQQMLVDFGHPSTVLDNDGYPHFAYSDNPESLINAFDAVFNGMIVNPDVAFTDREMGSDYPGVTAMFANDQLLYLNQAIGVLHTMRQNNEDFGILPFPKYNEEQDNYISMGSFWSSTYALPLTSSDPKQAGAILNVMGYYSVDTITEYIIQNIVMIRSTRDEVSEEMLRFAIANKSYDIGLCMELGNYQSTIYGIISKKENTFVSDMEKIKSKFENDIDKLVSIYKGDE